MQRNIELLIVMVATLVPFYLMASSLKDGSEFKSTGFGIAASAAIVGVYRMWHRRGQE